MESQENINQPSYLQFSVAPNQSTSSDIIYPTSIYDESFLQETVDTQHRASLPYIHKPYLTDTRRHTEGSLPVPASSSTKKKKAAVETDESKRKEFLERNRQAALKCRQRKKQWLADLQSRVEFLTTDNEQLQSQATYLKEQVINLKTLLLAHVDCKIAQSNGTTADVIQSVSTLPPQFPPNFPDNSSFTDNINNPNFPF